MSERIPPQNIRAERAVLGALLIDSNALGRVMSFLEKEDFYREAHQYIYDAVTAVWTESGAVDFMLVSSHLEEKKRLSDIGGEAYLVGLMAEEMTSVNAEHYAVIVHRLAVRRRAISASTEILALAHDTTLPIDEVVDGAYYSVSKLADRSKRSSTSFNQSVNGVYQGLIGADKNSKVTRGIPYGYLGLDEKTEGMKRTQLIIIAGRPSTGKTTLALNIIKNTSFMGGKVPSLLFSLESSQDEISERMLSLFSHVPTSYLNNPNGQDSDRMIDAMGYLTEGKFEVEDAPCNFPKLYSAAKSMHDHFHTGLIIIDYLQLIGSHSRHGNRTQEMADITRNLKGMARELNIPVIALSQLNRDVEKRGNNEMPVLSDLRDSGSLEQDADVVIFLRHNKEDNGPVRDVEINVAKNRNGATGTFPLRFHASEFRFEDVGYE